MVSCHDDVKRISFFTQLINLGEKGTVIEHIQKFQKLSLKVDGIVDDKLLDLFIITLKDNIQHEVCLFELTSLQNAFMVARKAKCKSMVVATIRTTSNTYRENNVPYYNLTQPTWLTPQ